MPAGDKNVEAGTRKQTTEREVNTTLASCPHNVTDDKLSLGFGYPINLVSPPAQTMLSKPHGVWPLDVVWTA